MTIKTTKELAKPTSPFCLVFFVFHTCSIHLRVSKFVEMCDSTQWTDKKKFREENIEKFYSIQNNIDILVKPTRIFASMGTMAWRMTTKFRTNPVLRLRIRRIARKSSSTVTRKTAASIAVNFVSNCRKHKIS